MSSHNIKIKMRKNLSNLEKNERKTIILVPSDWDDFGYRTTFNMNYYSDKFELHPIGEIKIYTDKSKLIPNPNPNGYSHYEHTMHHIKSGYIDQFSDDFCSIGFDLLYYEKLSELLPNDCLNILERLNDMAIKKDIWELFKSKKGVNNSLLRFSSTLTVLKNAKKIIDKNKENISNDISFEYNGVVLYSDLKIKLNFDFKKSDVIPYRINVLVGKNGTGKTQMLSNLANSLSGLTDTIEENMFTGQRPMIDRVISVSYSAFDKFKKPPVNPKNNSRSYFSYVYCGIQKEDGNLSLDELKKNLKDAYEQIEIRERTQIWKKIMSVIMEDEHQRTVELIINKNFDDIKLSSGQQIVICTITEIVANIENDSIVLFDEPEIHLHPNAISNIFRMFYMLLEEFNSYAIFSTHSPLVLQEIPSRYIQILDRRDDILSVRKPDIECFGNNINSIIHNIFDVQNEESNYKTVLKKLSEKHSYTEVNELFENNLSLNALIYLKSCYKKE